MSDNQINSKINSKTNNESGSSQSYFAICIDNSGYPVSLEKYKVYRVIEDADAFADGDLRVIDESGEDYLYPAEMFVSLNLPEQKNGLSSISKTRSLEEMAALWQTHSTADYHDQTYEVDVEISPTAFMYSTFPNSVNIEKTLFNTLSELAEERQISVETLVNLWLYQQVDHIQVPASPVSP